ncbi:MAG: uroporphyrinogen decarboxylase family protein [bacterium]
MTGRERVLTAMRREVPDRVPKTFSLCPSQMERFRRETGADDPDEYFGFEVRSVSVRPTHMKTDFSHWLGDTSNIRVDEWGIGWLGTESSYHFEDMIHPLRGAQTVEEIERYPFPDLDQDYRYEGIKEEVDEYHRRGYAVSGAVSPVGGTIFWPPYKLRSMEELLVDFYANPAIAEALLDRVTYISSTMAAKMASCGVDIIHTADDLGTQRGLMMSREMYRKWIKGRMAEVVESAKSVNPNVLVFFHSDGNVTDLIPDFIDIGIDILNPLQPECMDVAWVKGEYGKHLAFWGTIGTQTTMPFGTPEEVKRVVKERIKVVGRGGGFLIAPTHVVEPEVPWENIMAFVEAVEEYGRY